MTTAEFIEKIDNGEDISQETINNMVLQYTIHSEDIDSRTHVEVLEYIMYINGRYFATNREIGLTAYQENGTYEYPFEVIPVEQTVIITKYVPKNMK